jgi:hypothetical protein
MIRATLRSMTDPLGPRPPDVVFDEAAAQDALDQVDLMLDLLEETEDARSDAYDTAVADYAGVYADDFRDANGDLDTEATELRDQLETLRSALQTGIDDAEQAVADDREGDRVHDGALGKLYHDVAIFVHAAGLALLHDDGALRFHPDIYEMDASLDAALEELLPRAASRAQNSPPNR